MPDDVRKTSGESQHAGDSDWEGAEGLASERGRGERAASARSSRSSLEQRSRQDLYNRARELGVRGRGHMTKSDLIDAIRGHARNPSPRPADETPATSYISMRDP